MNKAEVAKNLLAGKICYNCFFGKYEENSLLRHMIKCRLRGHYKNVPKGNTCERWKSEEYSVWPRPGPLNK